MFRFSSDHTSDEHRLLFLRMEKGTHGNLDCVAGPLMMQSDLRIARQRIDRLPDWHGDMSTWNPGLAFGLYYFAVTRRVVAADEDLGEDEESWWHEESWQGGGNGNWSCNLWHDEGRTRRTSKR